MSMTRTRIDIRDIRVRAIIGINARERKIRQLVVINVAFVYDARKAIKRDLIRHAVDYKTMTHTIVDRVNKTRFYLIEHLTRFILDVILENPSVTRAKVTVDKPGALRHAHSVASTLDYRWRSDE